MKSYKKFLIEDVGDKSKEKTPNNNTPLIILQKIIDMVDDGHIEYDKARIIINVGKLIKDKNLYDLMLVIRKGDTHEVKIGKSKTDGKMAIVMDANRVPAREKIDTFLSRTENVEKIVPIISKYLTDHHINLKDMERNSSTSYEKTKDANQRKSFETKFGELRQAIQTVMDEYNEAKTELERQLSVTGAPARKETLKLSLEHLKDETLGKNSKEFIKKMASLVDPDFYSHLNKEWKAKLESRLESYYEHNIN